MLELSSLRSYHRKVFNKGNGELLYRCFAAHTHYKDDQGTFQDIDTNLGYDDSSACFKHHKSSYHCAIPQYADDWFEFYNAFEGVNHTIKARPVVDHILGEVDGNKVIYHNAYGADTDLRVYAEWSGLKKVIVIKEKPSEIYDRYFDFELDLPETSKVINKENIEWNKVIDFPFTNDELKIGDDNKFSYFSQAEMWDSSQIPLREKVRIELYVLNGITYLRKTVPATFLEKATFPVYTDHPTTYVLNSFSGYILSDSANSFADAYDGTAVMGSVAPYSGGGIYSGSYQFSPQWGIYRGFLFIDTSGIADTATVTAATLYLGRAPGPGGASGCRIVGSTAVVHSLASTDWSLVDGAQLSDYIADPNDGSNYFNYESFPFNAAGRTYINKTGYTKLAMREDYDLDGSPTADGVIYLCAWVGVTGFESDYGGSVTIGSYAPYLEVTTTGGEIIGPFPTFQLS